MSEGILGALITAVGAIVCQILISRSQANARKTDDAVRDALLNKRLKDIEEKLGSIATAIAVIQNDIKTLYRKGE